jgi:hypothetical protein
MKVKTNIICLAFALFAFVVAIMAHGWQTLLNMILLDRVNDRLSQLNTKSSILLHEAQDGEARVAGLISDYKSLLQEMRK